MKVRAIVVPALFVTSLCAVVACSAKKPPEPARPVVVDLVDAGASADAEAPSDAGMAGPMMGDAGMGDAGAAGALATGGEAATDQAIDTAIQALAAKNAPGMAPDGQPGRATLAQGAHFNMIVTMQPNQCYSVFGFSPAGGVQQLDLKLFAPPLYTVESGKAVNEKNQPIMGKGKAGAICPILPIAVPYKLDAAATKGAGRIGVWVYARAK